MNDLFQEQSSSREKTLLMALLLSAPGPLVTGYAAYFQPFHHPARRLHPAKRGTGGHLYLLVGLPPAAPELELGEENQARLEQPAGLSVAGAMACSGVVMLVVALSRLSVFEPGGKVTLGLVIAVLGFADKRLVLVALHGLDARTVQCCDRGTAAVVPRQSVGGSVCGHRAGCRRHCPCPSGDPLCGYSGVGHGCRLPAVERAAHGAIASG